MADISNCGNGGILRIVCRQNLLLPSYSLTMKTYIKTQESSFYVLKLQSYQQNRTLK
jgi:hypothetical protein